MALFENNSRPVPSTFEHISFGSSKTVVPPAPYFTALLHCFDNLGTDGRVNVILADSARFFISYFFIIYIYKLEAHNVLHLVINIIFSINVVIVLCHNKTNDIVQLKFFANHLFINLFGCSTAQRRL